MQRGSKYYAADGKSQISDAVFTVSKPCSPKKKVGCHPISKISDHKWVWMASNISADSRKGCLSECIDHLVSRVQICKLQHLVKLDMRAQNVQHETHKRKGLQIRCALAHSLVFLDQLLAWAKQPHGLKNAWNKSRSKYPQKKKYPGKRPKQCGGMGG